MNKKAIKVSIDLFISLPCIGNEKKLTIRDIVDLIRNVLNSRSKIEYSDKSMPFFNLSIEKAVSRYDFKPGNARDNIIRWCSQRLAAAE